MLQSHQFNVYWLLYTQFGGWYETQTVITNVDDHRFMIAPEHYKSYQYTFIKIHYISIMLI